MNILRNRHLGGNRSRAQSMTEFALALPIFMVLLLGVIEIGHLIFLYSAVFSGAREAARYGAAVGIGGGGAPYYADCAGIRASARKMIATIDPNTVAVTISYDNPDFPSEPAIFCNTNTFTQQNRIGLDTTSTPPDLNRLNVTVSTTYRPLIPLPGFPEMPINSTVSRTIIKDLLFRDSVSQSVGLPGSNNNTPPAHCPTIDKVEVEGNVVRYGLNNTHVGNNNRTIQSLTVFWIQNFASPFYELNEVKLTTLDAANGNPTYPLFTGADTTSYIELPAEYGDSYGWPLTSDPNRKLLPNTTGDDLVAGNGNFITVTFNAPPTIDMGGISIEISFDSGCNGVTDQNATKVTLP